MQSIQTESTNVFSMAGLKRRRVNLWILALVPAVNGPKSHNAEFCSSDGAAVTRCNLKIAPSRSGSHELTLASLSAPPTWLKATHSHLTETSRPQLFIQCLRYNLTAEPQGKSFQGGTWGSRAGSLPNPPPHTRAESTCLDRTTPYLNCSLNIQVR